MRKNNLFHWTPDRSGFPTVGQDGKPVIDLDSHKFVKIWHGPNHPGVTGNMSLELTISGDEIMESKTHVGYLHRGFEKLYERRTWALAADPKVILADEPTANLDSHTAEELLDLMSQLNSEMGTTFIFSSHDDKVISRGKRVIRLEDGCLASDSRSSL